MHQDSACFRARIKVFSTEAHFGKRNVVRAAAIRGQRRERVRHERLIGQAAQKQMRRTPVTRGANAQGLGTEPAAAPPGGPLSPRFPTIPPAANPPGSRRYSQSR